VVATEFGPGTLTESGYPYIVKLLKRGQTLAQAREVYRGSASDGGYGVNPEVLRDAAGRVQGVVIARPTSTFEAEHHLLTDSGPVKLDMPLKSSLSTYVDGQMVFTIEEPWKGFGQGAVLSYDLAALKRGAAPAPLLVLQPNERQAVEGVRSTRNLLLVNLYEDVKGAVDVYDFQGGRWSRTRRLALPENASVGVVAATKGSDRLFANAQGFLDPATLFVADAATGTVEKVKASPARFNAADAAVEQFWAVSRDGTRIPYFVVRPKQLRAGGAPTLLFGYGGFQVSKPPVYIPRWASSGSRTAGSSSTPTSAAAASSVPPGTSRAAREAPGRLRRLHAVPRTWSGAGSPRPTGWASTAAPTAGC
jgi:prolyl oligopeptidase